VNSVGHLWGYRNYDTKDGSRNNTFMALLVFGEGWHNNHHIAPNSAMHGHRWWEWDPSYRILQLLGALGLVKDVVLPPARNVH
jgi:stearoyl-CoA desaturase (delta-9 desaturase)